MHLGCIDQKAQNENWGKSTALDATGMRQERPREAAQVIEKIGWGGRIRTSVCQNPITFDAIIRRTPHVGAIYRSIP
jgi:hypothetical protein